MATLDRVEHSGMDADTALALSDQQKPLHPGLQRFVEHAVRRYLEAERRQDLQLDPVTHHWVARRTNQRTWELYAWGRRYQSSDGRLREFRFLRFGRAGERARPAAQVAIAAFSAAFGQPASWPEPWSAPFRSHSATNDTSQVRIVEIGLLDGSRTVLFEGSTGQAHDYFDEHGRDPVRQVAAGGALQPGAACAGCKRLTACEEPQKTPGLLQISSDNAELRTVSVSSLRHHRTCPAQAFMYQLNLPRANEYSTQAQVGMAVHAWLDTNHSGPVWAACNAYDMPRNSTEWTAGDWQLTGDPAMAGARMLAHHLDVCPFQHADGVSEVRREPPLAFYDTAAAAIVLATPDLLYRDSGAWVWRETKTTQRQHRSHADPLEAYPQLALAVLLLARGVFGGDTAASRVELETLRPDSADVELIDPTDPERIEKAGTVIRSHAEPWRADHDFEARTGQHCHSCPVSQWCPSYSQAALASATGRDQGDQPHD